MAQRLYGRSKGKKLRAHQSDLMRGLLPQLALEVSDSPAGALAPAQLFARPFSALHLEIGFGDGARLCARAKAAPDCAFIGCEPFENGVAKVLARVAADGLDNIRLHMGDARDALAALPDGALDQVEILYPDPWPKRRQNKRRIISDEFLVLLAAKMKPGAPLHFATDIDDYAAWTLARVLRAPDFVWPAETQSQWLTPYPEWFATRYEQKARREGRGSVYLRFARK